MTRASQAFQVAIYGLDSNTAVSNCQMYADNCPALTATSSAPVLTNRVSGDSVVLSWPQSAVSYSLQGSSVLASNSWELVARPPVLSNTAYSISLPLTGLAGFFRLQR